MAGEETVVKEEDAAAAAVPSDGRNLSEPDADRRRPPSALLRKAFICSFPDCDAVYNRAWKLDAHLLRHTGELPFVCHYEACGKGFTRLFHLKRHFLTHTGEKPFVCTAEGCNERFTTKSNLKKHFGRKHLQHCKEYICDFEGCGKFFKKHQQLKTHQSEHTGEPPFKCSHEGCEMGFSMRAHLKRHEKIHEGYACKKDGCSFVGKTWSELLKHMRQSHVEPITCSVCGKIFRRKDYLKCHQKIHAAEREVLKCPREGCGRTYTTLFNLQSHIVSFHEARTSFTCGHPGCGRVFAMKQSLVRHGVVHDPDKRKLNSKPKKPRPKRSLASHLSGFIPPKACGRNVSSVDKTLITPEASTMLPTVETLTLG